MESINLTLEQKSRKRANYALTITILVVTGLLSIMFLGQILQGINKVTCLVVAGANAIVAVTCVVSYLKNPLSEKFHYIAFAAFMIAYEMSCLSCSYFLYYIFIYP